MTPPSDKQGGVSESHRETIDTLRDIEAFFRKEATYEVENMGAGGSAIALGRWKRYYMTLANVVQDLPELIAQGADLSTLRRENEALRAAITIALDSVDLSYMTECDADFVDPLPERNVDQAVRQRREALRALLAIEAALDTARTLSNAKETT